MSQKSTEQLCVDDIVEIDGLKGEGPWSNKRKALFVDLMDEEVAKGNQPTTTFAKTRNSWDPLLGTINLEEEQWNELFKVNKRAKKFRKSGCPRYEKLVRTFGDTTATGVNACPSTRLISDSEDENENDVVSNTNFGVEENDKGKSKKTKNAKRKNDILEKRSFGCTSSEVDESQTSSKKDDLHKKLMECLDILNTMEDVDGEAYSKVQKLLYEDLTWRKLFLRMPNSRKRDFINSL
uniref:L10-interacting MYB domain-containing protein-like n=1 Tax=Cucumis melo TaxID=3656 RepID=A0A9I9E5D7_CUCME